MPHVWVPGEHDVDTSPQIRLVPSAHVYIHRRSKARAPNTTATSRLRLGWESIGPWAAFSELTWIGMKQFSDAWLALATEVIVIVWFGFGSTFAGRCSGHTSLTEQGVTTRALRARDRERRAQRLKAGCRQ